MNRSCPNLHQVKDDDTTQKVKQRNDELEKQLLTSNKIYNELLLETGDLKKKISEFKTKFKRLTIICPSPAKKKQPITQQSKYKERNFSKNITSCTASIHNDRNITAGQAEVNDVGHGMAKSALAGGSTMHLVSEIDKH